MKPYNVYLKDLLNRVVYILFSYFFCLTLIFTHINIIFLFETFPFLSILINKRFIFTQVTQVFNLVWFCCFFFSSIFTFPLVSYHLKCFFSSSWYKYQVNLYNKVLNGFGSLFLISYVSTHFIIIPNLLMFLLCWEIKDKNSLLQIEAEISLLFYVVWSLNLKLIFSLIFSIFLLTLLTFSIFLKITNLYKLTIKSKNIIIFVFICFLFLFIPPDLILQFFWTIASYLVMEFFFFLICTKLYNNIKLCLL